MFKTNYTLPLIIVLALFLNSCAMLFPAADDPEAVDPAELDKEVALGPEWPTSNFYSITDSTITAFGQGVASDSVSALYFAEEQIIANYRMALREIIENTSELPDADEVSLPQETEKEIYPSEDAYKAFVRSVFKR